MRILAAASKTKTPIRKKSSVKVQNGPEPQGRGPGTDPFRAMFEEGLAHHQGGRLAKAQAIYAEILKRDPRHAGAVHLLGVLLGQRKKHREALTLIDRAIELDPDNADAHNNRARVLTDLGRREEALAGFDRAVALRPDHAEAVLNRGNVLLALGRPGDALESMDHAVALKPDYAGAHASRGNALLVLQRAEEALASYDRAIALRPDYAEAFHGRGIALTQLGRLDAALASYDNAAALKPDHAEAFFNRANVLKDLGRMEAALASFDRAIALKPDYAEAFYNRGNVLLALRQPTEALASFDHALELEPRQVARHRNLALCRLLVGDFATGWQDYERRWREEQSGAHLRTFGKPLWLGAQSLEGRTILLHSEQGLGDTLQFCRYAPMVRALGARVILEAPEPLMGLLAYLDGVDRLVPKGKQVFALDFHCPLMSLPLAFKTSLETIPAPRRYIESDPALKTAWGARLGPKTRPRVGLAWCGKPRHKADQQRSVPLALMRSFMTPGIEWFSLHRELRESDAPLAAASPDLRHFGDEMDFDQTAALIDNLDLVISVDTAMAHLAGAMGKPVWVLLPAAADWRWLTDREDSPWYPSARLIRQERSGDWAPVMQRVYLELRAWLGGAAAMD